MERHNRESSPPLLRRPQRTASFPSAPGLRPWVLVLLFSILVLLFLPSFLSKGLRPAAGGLIKNGWDALNFLLVLFAILCGLLSRNNNSDDSPTASNSQQWLPSPSPKRSMPVQTPRFGDGYQNQIPTFGESVQTTPVHRRMRSSSSYPDLRHDWLPAEECRFYDDMYLDRRLPETRSTMVTPRHTFSQPAVETTPSHSIPDDKQTIGETVTENQSPVGRRLRSSSSYPDLRQEWVPADEWRFSDDIQLHRRQPGRGSPEVKTIPVDTFKLQRSTPPSPPPPPPRRRRTTRKLPKTDPEQEPPRTPPPPRAPPRAPPPPPPPPPPTPPRDPKRHQRKKSVGGAKDLASALAQFYQKKRKKSSSRSKASPDGAASPPAASGGGPPPPPPPPPPPSSVFNKLFTHKKNGSKAKRVHTVPPPPPPPPQIQRSKTQISQHGSPLPPTSPHSVRQRRDRSSHANSNLKSPPPPSPPVPSAATSPESATGEQGRLSCPPSPDVNNKADIFIARFRAGLELEKQNSIRAKEGQASAAPPTDDEEEMVIGTLFDD